LQKTEKELEDLERHLFDAVKASDAEEVKVLISAGVDVNATKPNVKTYDIESPLSVALSRKDERVIILLLQAGACYPDDYSSFPGVVIDTLALFKVRSLRAVAVHLLKSMNRVSN
jgi:hypothetical protein